ncbi:protein of unknown function [Taphrina deformans PYCC 5710]|uniref:Jacalin-type lectin domain-containing protein n=1 Tax=Taphrina deformans (strain PYCC 5710 / ATCC 11124 / CBS 356.35 / IMI 108563 / JCM 9778 / NBRC 8474) TaxID=1097556 RepID=R4XB64_TAPDE|nr:protein of unknown function [Taphrina deformans PYCC 5710]|eukprot:CCG82845.1 protein of unknown function [Taphrina deformans PYCC 5710]
MVQVTFPAALVTVASVMIAVLGHPSVSALPAEISGSAVLTTAQKQNSVPGTKKLHFGPEAGVEHDNLDRYSRGFDDTPFLEYDKRMHRFLIKVSCYHAHGTKAPWLITKYHGYTPASPFLSLSEHSYTLGQQESWSSVIYKRWGRKITGIRFTTSKGKGFSCGDWDYKVGCDKAKGCVGSELVPIQGHKIVGLYGDTNGDRFRSAQGIRGIGLITIPI